MKIDLVVNVRYQSDSWIALLCGWLAVPSSVSSFAIRLGSVFKRGDDTKKSNRLQQLTETDSYAECYPGSVKFIN